MAYDDIRESGIDGLVISGDSYWGYNLRAVYPNGKMPLIYQATIWREPPLKPFPVNQFRTVRDAKAAAQRLADVAPWGTPEIAAWAAERHPAVYRRRKQALIEGLLGRSMEEAEAENRQERVTAGV